jgi:hypothetical protein
VEEDDVQKWQRKKAKEDKENKVNEAKRLRENQSFYKVAVEQAIPALEDLAERVRAELDAIKRRKTGP